MRKKLPFPADPRGAAALAPASFNDAGLDAAVHALNLGFADYIVPMRWTSDALQRRMAAESVDPAASFVYRLRDTAVGVCMIARRGAMSRVAAFCVAPPQRKEGVGRRMLADALAAARARGDARMSLEVIEQNEGAVAFYRGQGFAAVRRLVGYRRAARNGVEGALCELPIAELAAIAERYEDAAVQWQLAAATLRALRAPARAFSLEDRAYALVSGERDDGFDLRAIVVPPEHRRAGWGRRMIDALTRQHGGKACNVAPIVPETLAQSFFTTTGFVAQEISQLEMSVALAPSA